MTIKKLTGIMAAGAILLAGAIGVAMQLTDPDKMEIDLQGSQPLAEHSADGVHILTDMEHSPLYYDETKRLLLPLRSVMEGLGGTVKWDGETEETEITYRGKKLRLRPSQVQATLNGYGVTLPAAAEVINGCLYGDETLFSVYFTDHVTFDIAAGQLRLQAKDASLPVVAMDTLQGEEDGHSYRVEVPVLLGLNDSLYEKNLNETLRRKMEDYIAVFLEGTEEGSLHLQLETGLCKKEFVSLRWEGEENGTPLRLSENIDLMGQKNVSLSDMLTQESFAAVAAEAGPGWAETEFYLLEEGTLVLLQRTDGLSLQYWMGDLEWEPQYQKIPEA